MSDEITSLSSTYFPAINVHKNSEIALLCLHTYICFRMWMSLYNFRIIIRQRNLDIKLPFSCYEIEDITQYICNQIYEDNESINIIDRHDKMYNDPKDFTMNTDNTRMKCVINCNYPIYFTIENSLASLLGFK
jgi:hypothetical protein